MPDALTLEAGPELDKAVAEAMGVEPFVAYFDVNAPDGEVLRHKPYSTDANAALEEAEKSGLFDAHAVVKIGNEWCLCPQTGHTTEKLNVTARLKTDAFPLAISRAVLIFKASAPQQSA